MSWSYATGASDWFISFPVAEGRIAWLRSSIILGFIDAQPRSDPSLEGSRWCWVVLSGSHVERVWVKMTADDAMSRFTEALTAE